MNTLSTLRSNWQTKLAYFLIGGAVLHFVPALYLVALIGTMLLLMINYRKTHTSSGSHLQAGRQLIGYFVSSLSARITLATKDAAASAELPVAAASTEQPRRPRRQRRPVVLDSSRYHLAGASEPADSDPATPAMTAPSVADLFSVDPVTDSGYRCFEHGLNHNCPLEPRD